MLCAWLDDWTESKWGIFDQWHIDFVAVVVELPAGLDMIWHQFDHAADGITLLFSMEASSVPRTPTTNQEGTAANKTSPHCPLRVTAATNSNNVIKCSAVCHD